MSSCPWAKHLVNGPHMNEYFALVALDGREGTSTANTWKRRRPVPVLDCYLRTIETPAPVGPLHGDSRFEKIAASLAPKEQGATQRSGGHAPA
jgi:hypothetical protein